MRRDCLSLTKATGRLSNEEPSFDTEEDFEFYTNLSEDFSVQIIEVCYGNGRGNLKGFQFWLGDMTSDPLEPSQQGSGNNVALPFIGKRGTETASTCERIVDGEGLNKIETSMKADGSYVNAIAFYNTNFQSWSYGQINNPIETWEFQHDHYWNDSELNHVTKAKKVRHSLYSPTFQYMRAINWIVLGLMVDIIFGS